MRTYICEIRTEQNNIYIKRDDLFPFSFGGNKARKAVNFFKEIDNGDFDTVVTYGSSSSNHCRVISNMATVRNIPCYIISPEEASEPTYNSKMMQLFGAEITTVPVDEVSRTIDEKLAELRECGRKPYFIPGGGAEKRRLGTRSPQPPFVSRLFFRAYLPMGSQRCRASTGHAAADPRRRRPPGGTGAPRNGPSHR